MQGYERVICSILRGESVTWPDSDEWSDGVFFEVCLQNGVAALVYYHLKQAGDLGRFPASLRDRLKDHYLQASAVELGRAGALAMVLKECSADGITPLLLKGVAVSYTHYPFPGLRERCDTDLFIRFEDIRPFLRVMARMGYRVAYPVYKSHQFVCINPQSSFSDSLDVHWRISNYSRFARVLAFREAFDRSVLIPAIPGGARALSAGDALLLACVHLAANPLRDASRLIWVYDVHLVLTAMDPGELLGFAKRAVVKQVQDACLQAVEKSRHCFATAIPAEVLELLSAPPEPLTVGKKIARSNLGLLWNDVHELPGISDKLALLRELFFPPKEYLLHLYGKSGWLWVLWLYLRYIGGGIGKRLMLK